MDFIVLYTSIENYTHYLTMLELHIFAVYVNYMV